MKRYLAAFDKDDARICSGSARHGSPGPTSPKTIPRWSASSMSARRSSSAAWSSTRPAAFAAGTRRSAPTTRAPRWPSSARRRSTSSAAIELTSGKALLTKFHFARTYYCMKGDKAELREDDARDPRHRRRPSRAAAAKRHRQATRTPLLVAGADVELRVLTIVSDASRPPAEPPSGPLHRPARSVDASPHRRGVDARRVHALRRRARRKSSRCALRSPSRGFPRRAPARTARASSFAP